jgi:hypothetical protein
MNTVKTINAQHAKNIQHYIYESVMYFFVTTFIFDVKFMKVQNNQERCVA